LIDERFSSVEAENLMKNNNHNRHKKSIPKKASQHQQLDAWAAMVLMEQFFNEQLN
jgi:RNase H-fold protein (predicted Holliday junction resolvase)